MIVNAIVTYTRPASVPALAAGTLGGRDA